jgi:hypothetical protein
MRYPRCAYERARHLRCMVRLMFPIVDSPTKACQIFTAPLIEPRWSSDADTREGVEQTKYVKEPEHDADDHDSVQDRLDTACHRDEAIHQPKQDAHYDQGYENLHERHSFLPFLAARHFHAGPKDYCLLCLVRRTRCIGCVQITAELRARQALRKMCCSMSSALMRVEVFKPKGMDRPTLRSF